MTDGSGSKLITDLPNKVAYMAQQDLLMPWMNILDNVLLNDDLTRPFFHKKANAYNEKREKALFY